MARKAHTPKQSETPQPIAVRAIRMGYYNHERIRDGDTFMLLQESDFSDTWMEKAPGAQRKITTGTQELKKKHDELLAASNQSPLPEPTSTGDTDVLTGG